MRRLSVVGLTVSLGLCSSLGAWAAEAPETLLYRYIDDKGVTVLDRQGVPPDYVGKGYEILNQRGRVVQVVPPAPTAEEIRAAEAAKVQASADAQLLHLYSSVDDVDRAKARKLAELDNLVAMNLGNLKGLRSQQGSLKSQAIDQERAGHPVPQALIDQINDLQERQQALQADIDRIQSTRKQAEAGFLVDRARVQKLVQQ